MLSFFYLFSINAVVLFFYCFIWGVIALWKRRADYADIAWGLGFIVIAWLSWSLGKQSIYGFLVSSLVTLWGCRLSLQIYLRNRSKGEDIRYQQLYKNGKGGYASFIFKKVFFLQGALLLVISLPLLWINLHYGSISTTFWVALCLWFLGWLIETIADYQIYIHKKRANDKKEIYQGGLWRYSRHPNYLGEIICWWSIWLFCLAIPYGEYFIFSPILLTLLIVFVSGIPMLEKSLSNRKGYEDYINKVPVLIPSEIVNGALYSLFWYFSLSFAAANRLNLSVLIAFIAIFCQCLLFFLADRRSLRLAFPLALIGLAMGVLQETIFIHFHLIYYPEQGLLPPLWLLLFYPVFTLLLNSTLAFLRKGLLNILLVGVFGSLVSYIAGDLLGAAKILSPLFYVVLPVSWTLFLLVLVLYNQSLRERYWQLTNEEFLRRSLTLFFDKGCPICLKEMKALQKREQRGNVVYAAPKNQEELSTWTDQFTFEESMKVIHALDENGEVYRGVDALAHLYAKTGLLALAVLLKAPLFNYFFKVAYLIWAKMRPTKTDSSCRR